ncbi:tetratricopeptide repeat protein, partial [Ralstonia sp. VS2407]
GDASPGAMLLWGVLDHHAGRHEQAIERWRALLRVQPLNLRVRGLLGAALLRSGDAAGTIEALRPVLARSDADPYALSVVARAFERLGDRATAARLLDRAAVGQQSAAGVFATDMSPAALAAAASAAPTDPTYAIALVRGLASTGRLDVA